MRQRAAQSQISCTPITANPRDIGVALALLGILSYSAGYLSFLVMSVIRAVVNAYRSSAGGFA